MVAGPARQWLWCAIAGYRAIAGYHAIAGYRAIASYRSIAGYHAQQWLWNVASGKGDGFAAANASS